MNGVVSLVFLFVQLRLCYYICSPQKICVNAKLDSQIIFRFWLHFSLSNGADRF